MDTSATINEQDEDLYLMSNVQPDESGLPFVVWISPKQGKHDVRVKIGKPPMFTASVSVRDDVRVLRGNLSNSELALVRQWIELNRQVIMDHWEGKIPSSRQVLNALKPLPKS